MSKKINIKVALLVVIFACAISYSYNLGLRRNERAMNRPFIDQLLWNLSPSDGKISLEKKRSIMRVLLLDHMLSEFSEPLSDFYRSASFRALAKTTTPEERSAIFDEFFSGVDEIQKTNALFMAGGEVKMTVLGGSPLVDKDYNGEECAVFLSKIKQKFLGEFYAAGK